MSESEEEDPDSDDETTKEWQETQVEAGSISREELTSIRHMTLTHGWHLKTQRGFPHWTHFFRGDYTMPTKEENFDREREGKLPLPTFGSCGSNASGDPWRPGTNRIAKLQEHLNATKQELNATWTTTDSSILRTIIERGVLKLNVRGYGTENTPGAGHFAALVTTYMSARELIHQIKPKKQWNLTGSPASFQLSHNACRHAVRCTRNLVSSGDRLVGLYRPVADTQRTFVKCPAVGISYIRTETQGDGNQPDHTLHIPYLTCIHCKQSGATTITPCTAWHAVSCGHMSAVRSEGALIAEEYLDFMRWNAVELGWRYS